MPGMRSFDDPAFSVGACPCGERLSCTEPWGCQGLGPSGFHPTRLRAPLVQLHNKSEVSPKRGGHSSSRGH